MANPEHLKIFLQGVEVWNKWREENKDVLPDLSNIRDIVIEHLGGVNLNGANLSNTILAGNVQGVIRNVNLRGATLRMANLGGAAIFADFDHADLSNADLSKATLASSRFWNTKLRGANFGEARFHSNGFNDIDLSEVRNLESVMHFSPSSIGIDTIYKSRGNIPEKFLRGCGVPEDFITYMRSLTAKAIEFYSCFISYSSKDEEFAKRLYNDLQSEGVRCWFAPEDLKIGEKLRVRIDEAVRLHDKLLLILSKNSVASQWVEKEVETAFEKESKQRKTVLFPVRLDDAVMKKKTGWAADIRKSRHIGDFRDWKNHDSYKKAFERLMRDLKAGEKR